jgi:hypothetical protein
MRGTEIGKPLQESPISLARDVNRGMSEFDAERQLQRGAGVSVPPTTRILILIMAYPDEESCKPMVLPYADAS